MGASVDSAGSGGACAWSWPAGGTGRAPQGIRQGGSPRSASQAGGPIYPFVSDRACAHGAEDSRLGAIAQCGCVISPFRNRSRARAALLNDNTIGRRRRAGRFRGDRVSALTVDVGAAVPRRGERPHGDRGRGGCALLTACSSAGSAGRAGIFAQLGEIGRRGRIRPLGQMAKGTFSQQGIGVAGGKRRAQRGRRRVFRGIADDSCWPRGSWDAPIRFHGSNDTLWNRRTSNGAGAQPFTAGWMR